MDFPGGVIYTIGHGNKTFQGLWEILNGYHIEILCDIRSYPKSKRNPQFDRQVLAEALHRVGIDYVWERGLGGFRKSGMGSDSPHKALTSKGFRNYADYMLGQSFKKHVKSILEMVGDKKACLMCAETLASQCHRSYLSDYLESRGTTVVHIVGVKECMRHVFSPNARVEGKNVIYDRVAPRQLELGVCRK